MLLDSLTGGLLDSAGPAIIMRSGAPLAGSEGGVREVFAPSLLSLAEKVTEGSPEVVHEVRVVGVKGPLPRFEHLERNMNNMGREARR